MKTAKRIFFILTVVCGALAVVFDIVAVCMQVQVSGEKLLTMDSHWGYILAVNYRWVTLAAVILTVSALAMLTAYILYSTPRRGVFFFGNLDRFPVWLYDGRDMNKEGTSLC